ncbi:uncharacterized protein LOC122255888 [Penaeus japonicus]|uniref:uncharacterized protein LOC122255888 n=1 Tax=Penaeus japonicus TaxID=27405 RepID=UPI001C71511A|nr:uncharacterized protein LOC122255888 [Penaeus japonicus]XP_042876183.1 uncharacterized protein LOC122255888 [Penaeus japonicus]XP_042876184.1 uncharacterized protein LOC122255888 [Penaeus japonicus]XP_042876185.1 uncharacterized protein LOC122255888 [Penaeus japonicus]XP_042876186.1 uncharacterized protein LOC122255888 [Penaeus japonicus]XP_042876187.1 uncharacterized protein LOC122255888 [Penaeus japonicus]XP_042876188.1 uncharacterized protein LOC122255888 [Penaeus japonicus]XP_04287618
MEIVHEMRQELEEAVKDFHRIQEMRQQYLQKCNVEITNVLKQFLDEKLRMELQEHFECRNEILEGNVKCIDDTINAACDAHDDVFYLRNQIAEIFNEGISPKLNADGSDVLVAGRGMTDFQKLSYETKDQVMVINKQQELYEMLMSEIKEVVLRKLNQTLCGMDTSLQEVHKQEKENLDALTAEITTEIEKNIRLQGTLQIIQSQMNSLSERLQAPL